MGKMEQRKKYFSLKNLCILLLPSYIVLSLGVSMNKVITCFTTTLNQNLGSFIAADHKACRTESEKPWGRV